jgi:hypothetical protein
MFLLVVVDNPDLDSIPVLPTEADPPLVIHSHTPLAVSVGAQFLKISWRNSQVVDNCSRMHQNQLSLGSPLNVVGKDFGELSIPYPFGLSVCPRCDHFSMILPFNSIVKHYHCESTTQLVQRS